MALLSAYTDVTYANDINRGLTEWDDASMSERSNALVKARYFIDSNYTCSPPSTLDVSDLSTVPDEYQVANALLAVEYLKGTLYLYDDLAGQKVVSKKVKADKVESQVTYSGFMSSRGVKASDKYPEVTALLSVYCTLGSGGKLDRV